VVVSLLVCLLLIEAATRAWVASSEARASLDTLNIRSLSRTADAMHGHDGHKALVLGNSLAHGGVLGDVLGASLEKAGHLRPGVFLATPSGSTALHWHYALRRYFMLPGRLPAEVFVCGHPWHFTDHFEENARLRQFYVADADFGRAWSEMPDWDAKVGFALAHVSALFGVKTGLKVRLLGSTVPDYAEMEIHTQRMRWATAQPSADGGSCEHLVQLLDELAAHHIRTHLVAMPSLREPGRASAAVLETAAAHGADVIDLTSMPGLGASCYQDGFHLNAKGAQLFSRQLALALEERGVPK